MAVYIGIVPPVGWEHVWDEAARRASYTGPRPQVIMDATELARHGGNIGALVTRTVTPELLAAAPHLRLVQVPFAGVDSMDLTTLKRAGVPLANSHGNREVTAEHAIALMFALARRIIPYDRDLRQGIWHGFATMDEPVVGLFGKTVGIAGLGNIGAHILRVCRAMDMRVLGLKRTPGGACSDLVDRAYGSDEKMEFLRASDFVIDVLPLTAETEKFFGRAEFEAMRGHWFINIGRGRTVDEKALYDALKDGTLAGAGIDPWWVYPASPVTRDATGAMIPVLPAHQPFWELPNVVMSPHTGGFADVSVEGLWGESFENAIRADRGETPRNLVDLERGY
ncbi:MAG: 2-hydroxyacid dehydrogenase [Caldiserica bacterium]|nr:2-hydroxyacid dehydrogenase [Caldisericota bacterium]